MEILRVPQEGRATWIMIVLLTEKIVLELASIAEVERWAG